MDGPLLIHDRELVAGTVVDRPNRFVLRVEFDGEVERVHLPDPGALVDIVYSGAEVVCSPADTEGRTTAYDAVAARIDGGWASLRPVLANDLFAAALARDLLPGLEGYSVAEREPSLPDSGRTDFLLEVHGRQAYAEVKSATHVDAGVAKFPDRQTERGRRQLRSLEELVRDGEACHVVFVVGRPDARVVQPYREIDPGFADLLSRVREVGVGVQAMAVAFDPPAYRLSDADLPVEDG